MKAELISVGTELLLGDIINTNAQYIAKRLADIGIFVYYQTVVGDNPKRLEEAYDIAFKRSELVITTGGLGPTKDDLTKEIGARYFGKELVPDTDSLQKIETFFKNTNRIMTENNKKQALFPAGSKILPNPNGTAPGCIIEEGGKILIMLPGPPKEMAPMFEASVMPYLEQFQDCVLVSKVLRVLGLGESLMEDKIKDIMDSQTNPTIAPYAKEGEATLRITARGKDRKEAEDIMAPVEREIRARLKDDIYGTGDTSIDEVVARELIKRKLTIALAESCTGGLLASRLVRNPGVSAVLVEGAVTYSNDAKMRRLNVKGETLDKYGAVSEQTASEMVQGIVKSSNADIGISVTGIAGPDGGTIEKPVGLVYVGLYINGRTMVRKFNFSGNRQKVQNYTVINALDWLRRELEHMN